MADGQDRTEQATPRRRQEARSKGQVARSQEVNSVLILLLGFFVIRAAGGNLVEQLRGMMQLAFGTLTGPDMTTADVHAFAVQTGLWLFALLAPIFATIALAGIAASVLQTGLIFSLSGLSPKFERLNPIEGAKRFFSFRAPMELFKSLLKIGIVLYLAYRIVGDNLAAIIALPAGDFQAGIAGLAGLVFDLALKIAAALLVIAGLDYVYQRFQHERSLRMSKEEVKEEMKQTEGSPTTKMRIRRKQRQMAQARMMQRVPKAQVVITNPTHFAVAIEYDAARMAAPVVSAKGADLIAEQIKKVARAHGVPVVENKPLARALYQSVDFDQPIPPVLYQAVAEVLAFIYRLRAPAAVGVS